MSGAVSLHFREQMLRRIFLGQPLLTDGFVAVTKTVPASNVTGDDLDEPPSNYGYQRMPYHLVEANWELISDSEVGNLNEIEFNQATGDWGRLAGWAYCTAQTGGLLIACGPLRVPTRVETAGSVVVKRDALSITLGDARA